MYVHTESDETFSTLELRKKHKNTSFPLIDGERKPSDEWLEDNGYVRVEQPVADAETQKSVEMAAHLASYTTRKINSGVTVSGIFIATGESDRALINGAVTRALLDGDDSLPYAYYPTGGGVVTLTNAQYKTIGRAIADHVQNCLEVESSLDPSDYDTTDDLEDAFDSAYSALP